MTVSDSPVSLGPGDIRKLIHKIPSFYLKNERHVRKKGQKSQLRVCVQVAIEEVTRNGNDTTFYAT